MQDLKLRSFLIKKKYTPKYVSSRQKVSKKLKLTFFLTFVTRSRERRRQKDATHTYLSSSVKQPPARAIELGFSQKRVKERQKIEILNSRKNFIFYLF